MCRIREPFGFGSRCKMPQADFKRKQSSFLTLPFMSFVRLSFRRRCSSHFCCLKLGVGARMSRMHEWEGVSGCRCRPNNQPTSNIFLLSSNDDMPDYCQAYRCFASKTKAVLRPDIVGTLCAKLLMVANNQLL